MSQMASVKLCGLLLLAVDFQFLLSFSLWLFDSHMADAELGTNKYAVIFSMVILFKKLDGVQNLSLEDINLEEKIGAGTFGEV